MSKILIVTTGLTGITNASFELTARLQAEGYQVVCAAPRTIADRYRQQGIDFIELLSIHMHPGPILPKIKDPFRRLKRLLYKYRHLNQRKQQALKNTDPIDFEKTILREAPDLILVDIELHEYIFKIYKLKIPFFLLSQWFTLWKSSGIPYLLEDTIPGVGRKGTNIAIALNWWKVRLRRWWIFTKQKWYSGFTDRRTTLLRLAKKEGFPLNCISSNYWPGPFTYSEIPVLSMTAKELEFPHQSPSWLSYIGPMVKADRQELKLDDDQQTKLNRAFAYRKQNQAALIYCSVSTLSTGDQSFIKKLIKAVQFKKEWVLIIALGGNIDISTFGTLPDHCFIFPYAPQLTILAQADCSINHGGIHTINECIHFGIPMLVYSGKMSDQNGCAARIQYHGIGITADKDEDEPATIRHNIEKVLTDDRIRQRINKLHVDCLDYKKERILGRIIKEAVKDKVNEA